MSTTAVFFGEELAKYSFGKSHPFNSDRIYAFWSKFNALDLDKSSQIRIVKPDVAQEESILQFQDKDYVEFIKNASKLGTGLLDLGDTPAFKGVFEASSYVVGTSLKALDLVMTKADGISHAFNPVGGLHHARRGAAGGFCVFNDIGIVIMAARRKYGITKIAYVDIDAHHGDGVYYEFQDDPMVFVADIHEDGRYLYPGTGNESETGSGDAKGTKLNIQLKPDSDDNDFIAAFNRVEEFIDNIAKPQLIILQCGADCVNGDPLTHLKYSPKAHKYAAEKLHQLSHKHCDARMIALGGGGYNRSNVANAWIEVINSLTNS